MTEYARTIDPDDRDGLTAYAAVCDQARRDGETPAATADHVAVLVDRWPWLADEVNDLRAMGDHWRNASGHWQGCELVRQAAQQQKYESPQEYEPPPDLFDGAA